MADSAPSASKRRSLSYGDEDRISRLPDKILSHILSFLPTKYAVLTDILSNRWRSIWTSVPNFDFDDSLTFNPDPQKQLPGIIFLNFVNRVFILRNSSSCRIETFHLHCCRKYDPPHFNPWICSAIANGVRELNLSYMGGRENNIVELPRSLFTCQKLEVLKLRWNFRIHIPDYICLPSLRVLHIMGILYNGGSSTVETLISSCPVLEELFIDREWDDSLETLVIISCSLKSLNIRADIEEFDAASYYEYTVVVDAPNLVSFNLSYYLAHGILHINSELRFLVNADIDDVKEKVDGEDDGPFHGPNLMELLNAISNVKFLTLSDNAMDYLGLAIRKLANIIAVPKFCNLTDLDVKMGGNGWLILPKLLECVPNLNHFIFHGQMNYESSIHEMPNYKPKCLSKLEMVDIKGFEGSQEEIELVRYILESAMALKKMMIYSKDMPSDIESTILKKLIRFPRSSKCCELMFF